MSGNVKPAIPWSVGLVLLALGAHQVAHAAGQTAGPPPPVQMTSQEDRQRIMGLLNISSMPGGPPISSPDTYDEARANPSPALPDPLVLKNGKKVTNAKAWRTQRRAEILEDFEREIGRKDMGTTEFPAIETALTGGDIAFRQHSGGHTDGPNWPAFLTFAERYLKGRAAHPVKTPGL